MLFCRCARSPGHNQGRMCIWDPCQASMSLQMLKVVLARLPASQRYILVHTLHTCMGQGMNVASILGDPRFDDAYRQGSFLGNGENGLEPPNLGTAREPVSPFGGC